MAKWMLRRTTADILNLSRQAGIPPVLAHILAVRGYKTPEAWFAYLRKWKEELAHPVTVKIKGIR